MRLTETIHFMAGDDVLKWNDVTNLNINEYLFRLKFLHELNKKRQRENA